MYWGLLFGIGAAVYAKKSLEARHEHNSHVARRNTIEHARNTIALEANEIRKERLRIESERHEIELMRLELETMRDQAPRLDGECQGLPHAEEKPPDQWPSTVGPGCGPLGRSEGR